MKTIDKLINHSDVSEKAIERYLAERIKDLGGVCLKYSNPNQIGYPDRVALMPKGRCYWFELKSKGGKLSRAQKIRINQLDSIGHRVFVVDSKTSIDGIFKGLGYEV